MRRQDLRNGMARALPGVAVLVMLAASIALVGCGKNGPTYPRVSDGSGFGGGGGGGGNGATAPVAGFTASRLGGDAPVTIQFTDRSTGTVESWRWDFGDGGISAERNPSHTYTDPKLCNARLTVTGPAGNDSHVLAITVDKVIELNGSTRFGPYWPSHDNQPGDCDFSGHGPEVKCSAWLEQGAGNRSLYLSFSMWAKETQPDGTEAEGGWLRPALVYTAPTGLRVKNILSAARSDLHFFDSDHAYRNENAGELGGFSVMGDTDGNDVCNATLDDTHMYFWLHHVKFRVGP